MYFLNILKKYKYELFLLTIIFVALLLRLMGLDKPYGLWYDEMMVYIQACKSFPIEIIKDCILVDVHMPVYQLLLSLWMKVFGNNDIVIRGLSVVIGTLGVPAIYFAGKELGGKRLGVIAALLLAVNSCSIYYSQELKFYIMLILFSSCSAFFFLRLLDKQDRKNYAGFVLTNLMIIYTFTIGIIFTFSQCLVLLFYFRKNKKESIKEFLTSTVIGLALSIPSLMVLLHAFFRGSGSKVSVMSIFAFDFSSWVFLIQNWFAPKISISMSNQVNYFATLFNSNNLNSKIFFIFLPLIIIISMLFLGLKRNTNARWLFLNIGVLLAVTSILMLTTDFVPTTRFGVIIIPFVLLVVSSGFAGINSNLVRRGLLALVCFIYLGYGLFSPNAPNKKTRGIGQKPPAAVMQFYKFGKKDVIFTFVDQYPTSLFDKYYKFEGSKFDANALIYDPDIMKFQGIHAKGAQDTENNYNLKKNFREYLKNSNMNEKTKELFKILIGNKLKKGSYLMIVSPYPPGYTREELVKIATDDKLYEETPLYFMPIYKFQNDMISIAERQLKTVEIYLVGSWKIYVFQKEGTRN